MIALFGYFSVMSQAIKYCYMSGCDTPVLTRFSVDNTRCIPVPLYIHVYTHTERESIYVYIDIKGWIAGWMDLKR